jgi:hypothetical protein
MEATTPTTPTDSLYEAIAEIRSAFEAYRDAYSAGDYDSDIRSRVASLRVSVARDSDGRQIPGRYNVEVAGVKVARVAHLSEGGWMAYVADDMFPINGRLITLSFQPIGDEATKRDAIHETLVYIAIYSLPETNRRR